MNEDEILIEFISRDIQKSDYDWANITIGEVRVGKARCLKQPDMLIIFSVNIFPNFEGRGFGRKFVEEMKSKYEIIVADRVRHSAVGFWERLGFQIHENGAYIYRKA